MRLSDRSRQCRRYISRALVSQVENEQRILYFSLGYFMTSSVQLEPHTDVNSLRGICGDQRVVTGRDRVFHVGVQPMKNS